MLGWEVYIRRKNESESNDPRDDIAKWNTSVYGLYWIDDLVNTGDAINLGGNGYPNRYSIKAGLFRSILNKGIPSHNSRPIIGEDYYLPAGYNSPLQVNNDILNKCPDYEELIVTAWDLS